MKHTQALGPLAFGFAYLVPLVLLWSLQGQGLWYFSVPLLVFGLIPIADALLGTYLYNPDPQTSQNLLESRAFKVMAWGYVPVQILLVVGGAWWFTHVPMAMWEQIGFVLSVGICTGGIGITLAHELLHKTSRFERFLSQILLGLVSYLHFYIEHLRGHHRRVATPEDPASARLGESFYRFYFRTLSGSWLDAWRLEHQRLQKKKLPLWRHQMIGFTAIPIVLAASLGWVWGWPAALFFAGQSVIAFSLLEAVNYVEHYGLSRQQVRPGVYEGVKVTHSWNSNHLLTNCLLFMLQRHSDHHAHQSRRYQVLRQFEESPQLPAGYATMILVALVPTLWKRWMDPRVKQYYEGSAPVSGT